jgi:predicted ribosome quality control (RQC) complex YloA/Tae2 family protein
MELDEKLRDGYIFELCSRNKNELTISFITSEGTHFQLIVITGSQSFNLYTSEGLNRKKRNTAKLFRSIEEDGVTGVEMSPFDREIKIHLESGTTLLLQLFTARTNVLLLRDSIVIDAFKHREQLAGTTCLAQNNQKSIIHQLEALSRNHAGFMAASFDQLPGFDRALYRELIERAEDPDKPEAIFRAFQELFYELLDPRPHLKLTDKKSPAFSILHESPYPPPDCSNTDSVLEGLNLYRTKIQQFTHRNREQTEFRKKLSQRLKKAEKELKAFSPEQTEALAAQYELFGHLLIAALFKERTSPGHLDVNNLFEKDEPLVRIPLNPALTLHENARDYFTKASKSREKTRTMLKRQKELETERQILSTVQSALDELTDTESIETFITAHSTIFGKTGRQKEKKAVSAPFRSVILKDGVTLFIGKNAGNNELLTFSHAKPGDIWLHSRGASGSHCILRGVSLHDKTTIEQAASIAAWHSSAKHAELVPVIYTLKKYVRRGKKLPPGQVIAERETLLFVKPQREH